MQSKYLMPPILCAVMLISFSGCSKKSEDFKRGADSAAAPAPAPAPGAGFMAAPVAAQARAIQGGSSADKATMAEPGTVATKSGVDRSAQLVSSTITYNDNDNERKFIRTATIKFRVADVYRSALSIEDTVASAGGFVSKNDISSVIQQSDSHAIGDGKTMTLTEYVVQGSLIIRVPSAKTADFLRAIADQIVFLDQRTYDAHDAQFDLLRKQLEYARNQEAQQNLGQATKEGGKLEQKTDAITAQNDAKAARDEALIEKKEFDDQVAFSTINFSIYQLPNVIQSEGKDVDAIFRANRPGFFRRMLNATKTGWESFQDFAIWMGECWPFWIIAIVLITLIRAYRRRKVKNAPTA